MTVEKKTPSILVRARNYYRKKGFRSLFRRIAQEIPEWNLLERKMPFSFHQDAIDRRNRPRKTGDFSTTPGLSDREDTALIFLHIPKTAGTSIRSLVEGVFAAPTRVYLYEEPPGISLKEFRGLPKEAKEQIRLVFGHVPYGVHEWLPQRARYITVLRDPVDRVVSLYYHNKTMPGNKRHQLIVENNLSLEEFVFCGHALQTDNGMVRYISGVQGMRFGECSEDVLDMAYRNIENHFECVLTMENLQQGIAKLSEILGLPMRGVRKMNVNRARQQKESIDPLLVRKIEALNRFDRELYDWIKRKWEE